MFDVFGTVRSLIKLETVRIDNNVFRLHYRFTVVLLITFSIIVNSRQYFGDPIDCTADAVTERVIDNYCWMHSFLTLPDKKHPDYKYDAVRESELPYYGVRAQTSYTYDTHLRYYQWVGFVLFFQAAFFFLPRFIWKYYCEGLRVKSLITGLTTSFGLEEKECSEKIRLVLNYLKRNQKQNTIYAFSFFFCEFLNLVNVILQIIVTDVFLNGEFSSIGFKVFRISEDLPDDRGDHLNVIFPKVARCVFKYTGHGQGVTSVRSICVLPVNTFNQKIYIVLWFWFYALTIISFLHLIYTCILIFVPRARAIQLQRHFRVINEDPWEEPSQAQVDKRNEAQGRQMTDDEIIQTVTNGLPLGDWFLLYQLGKNMDALIFGKLLTELAMLTKGAKAKKLEPITANSIHRNSASEVGKRGSFMGVGIGGSSAPLLK